MADYYNGAKKALGAAKKVHGAYKEHGSHINAVKETYDSFSSGETSKLDVAVKAGKKGLWMGIMSTPMAIPSAIIRWYYRGKDRAEHGPGDWFVTGKHAILFRMIMRPLQFILGLVVIGMYLSEADTKEEDRGLYEKVVYVEVLAGVSALTALIFNLPFCVPWYCSIWDLVLFNHWAVAFGMLGTQFIGSGDTQMEVGAWAVFVSLAFWMISAGFHGVGLYKCRYSSKQSDPEKGQA